MPELNPCECGCGALVPGRFKRGHASRVRAREQAGAGSAGLRPLTLEEISDDDDSSGYDDAGDILAPDEGSAGRPAVTPEIAAGPADTTPDGDEPPAHARRGRGRPKGSKTRNHAAVSRPPALRITAGVRADITAKISMPLEIGGQIWAARDQLCGVVFLNQRPAIAEALTDIVCESADLVAFFTGPGGAFMRYLNLAAALWPVVEVAAAHHVWHTVEIAEGDPNQPEQHQY